MTTGRMLPTERLWIHVEVRVGDQWHPDNLEHRRQTLRAPGRASCAGQQVPVRTGSAGSTTRTCGGTAANPITQIEP